MDVETNSRFGLNTSANTQDDQSPEAIRSGIEHTRSEMSDAAHELGRRLQPKRIMSEFVDNSPTLQFVKRHPVSLSLLAIGLGVYMIERRRPISVNLHPKAASESLREGVDMVKERVSVGTAALKEKVSQAGESMRHATESVRESARELAHRSMERGHEMYEANPLAVGAAAMAAGVAIGWALPSTEPERRLMGEKSRELMEKAKDQIKEKSNTLVSDVKDYMGASTQLS